MERGGSGVRICLSIKEAQELNQWGKKWHIIEGHFGAKLLIDKSTNLPGRR